MGYCIKHALALQSLTIISIHPDNNQFFDDFDNKMVPEKSFSLHLNK